MGATETTETRRKVCSLEGTRGDKGDLVLIARASIIQGKSNYWFQLCDTVSRFVALPTVGKNVCLSAVT